MTHNYVEVRKGYLFCLQERIKDMVAEIAKKDHLDNHDIKVIKELSELHELLDENTLFEKAQPKHREKEVKLCETFINPHEKVQD